MTHFKVSKSSLSLPTIFYDPEITLKDDYERLIQQHIEFGEERLMFFDPKLEKTYANGDKLYVAVLSRVALTNRSDDLDCLTKNCYVLTDKNNFIITYFEDKKDLDKFDKKKNISFVDMFNEVVELYSTFTETKELYANRQGVHSKTTGIMAQVKPGEKILSYDVSSGVVETEKLISAIVINKSDALGNVLSTRVVDAKTNQDYAIAGKENTRFEY